MSVYSSIIIPWAERERSQCKSFIPKLLLRHGDGDYIALDDSQQEAIRHALSHRLAIIQGPPGTGKTYVGVKLVRLLLSVSTRPPGPIVVLTYKNHALDEFLKQCVGFLGISAVARLGGRSRDPALDACQLRTMKWHTLSPSLRRALGSGKDQVGILEMKAGAMLKRLAEASIFSKHTFLRKASNEQVWHFLHDFSWPDVDTRELPPSLQLASGRGRMSTSTISVWIRSLPDDISLKDFLMDRPPPRPRRESCSADDSCSDEESTEFKARQAEKTYRLNLLADTYEKLHCALEFSLSRWVPSNTSLQEVGVFEKDEKATPTDELKNHPRHAATSTAGKRQPHNNSHASSYTSANGGQSSQPRSADAGEELEYDIDAEEEHRERMAAFEIEDTLAARDGQFAVWTAASSADITRFQPTLLGRLMAAGVVSSSAELLQTTKLWSMTDGERAVFIQLQLQILVNELDAELDHTLDEYGEECEKLNDLKRL